MMRRRIDATSRTNGSGRMREREAVASTAAVTAAIGASASSRPWPALGRKNIDPEARVRSSSDLRIGRCSPTPTHHTLRWGSALFVLLRK